MKTRDTLVFYLSDPNKKRLDPADSIHNFTQAPTRSVCFNLGFLPSRATARAARGTVHSANAYHFPRPPCKILSTSSALSGLRRAESLGWPCPGSG